MYQVIILGFILFASLFILKRVRQPKLNMPPLVRYKIPIIGHTYSYMFNSEEFLKQCKKEYGDIFSVYVWGQIRTVVGKEYTQEILSRDDTFNFGMAFGEKIPYDLIIEEKGFVNIAKYFKEYIYPKLNVNERMQKCLYSAAQKYMDIGDEERKIFNNIYHLMTKIISSTIANIFIGEEDEIVTTFAEFTSDLSIYLIIPPFLNFIHPGYLNRILVKSGLYNPSVKHRNMLIEHIKKQVRKRLQEKAKYGDSWKRPDDLLQDIIDHEINDLNNINYPSIADQMIVFLFPSIHTTSTSCANVLLDLASRPQYMQELYEEQLEVHEELDENYLLPPEAFNNMKKLDSFIRESLRLTGNIVALEHSATKDYTFSKELQVPKGHLIHIYVDDIYQDELLQGPNPKSFEPFRHVDANSFATKIGKNYMPFGGGKHACPGRHFAINEIKFFMRNIILKYNLRTASGKIEEKERFGPIARPSSGGIIIEKRVK